MKKSPTIVVTTDCLTQRDHSIEMIEAILEVFEDAEIYTFVHKQGAILGPIEQRKIHSSFLSNKVNTLEQLAKNSFLIPVAAKKLFIPCKVDLIINFSRGLSHGISKCKETKQVTYLYDDYFGTKKNKGLKEKFFAKFVQNWAINSLKQVDELWVSSESMKSSLSYLQREINVLAPAFKVSDFPIIPSPTFKYDYYLINSQGISPKQANELIALFEREGTRYRFIGEDSHLEELKNDHNDSRFFGNRCSGELAPLLSGAKALIDLDEGPFPKTALSSLASGRPVIVNSDQKTKDFLAGPGVFFVKGSKLEDIRTGLAEVTDQLEQLNPQKLRATAIKYHDIKFKSELKRRIDKYLA